FEISQRAELFSASAGTFAASPLAACRTDDSAEDLFAGRQSLGMWRIHASVPAPAPSDRHSVCTVEAMLAHRAPVSNPPALRRTNMVANNAPTLVGLFDDRFAAEQALDELHQAGFDHEQVGFAIRGSE